MRKFECPYGHHADFGYCQYRSSSGYITEVMCCTCYRIFVIERPDPVMINGNDRVLGSIMPMVRCYEKDTEMSRMQATKISIQYGQVDYRLWRGGSLSFTEDNLDNIRTPWGVRRW